MRVLINKSITKI